MLIGKAVPKSKSHTEPRPTPPRGVPFHSAGVSQHPRLFWSLPEVKEKRSPSGERLQGAAHPKAGQGTLLCGDAGGRQG